MKRLSLHRALLGCLALAGACAVASSAPRAFDPVTVAVADFDYIDTSGEVLDQERVHAERLRALAENVRAGLDHSGRFRVVALVCDPEPCSAGRTDPIVLLAKAHKAGARLLIYGGIQKMSTLIQYGNAQVLDLEADRLVFNRNISFRGDNDEAWRRAAQFLVSDLVSQDLVN